MLRSIVRFSIRYRGVVMALACLLVAYGVYVITRSKYDVYPEFTPPQVIVQTEAPAFSPEEVEALVTRPIENAVNGVAGLEIIRAQSIQGLSVVTVIFEEHADVFRARQVVNERLGEVTGRLPQGTKPPIMSPLTSAASLVLAVGLTSETRSLMDLRTFADWTLRPRLLGVPGVAKAVVFGGEVRQLQIQVQPERLAAFNLSISDVLSAARSSTGILGAGFIENEAQRIVLQTEGQSLTSAELGDVPLIRRNGMTIRMKDIARVEEAPEPKVGDAAINGVPGVMLMISSQYGANTLEVTAALENALAELGPSIAAEGITLHEDIFRPADFIQTAIRNINRSLGFGAVLVSVVLFLFLLNLRTAFISLTAIPLSLLMAIGLMDRLGFTLNTLTLGGLAIAIGEVVDDAIIDVENIFRRLRENAALPVPEPFDRVVLRASLEVRGAVVYATFVVALVFLPVLTMSGVQGRLFGPLAVAYILAIMGSLLVALTLTPALSSALLPPALGRSAEPALLRVLKDRYRRVMRRTMERPAPVFAAAGLLCAAAVAALPFFGGEFLPDLKEGHFIVHMSAVPGTSVGETMRIGNALTRDIRKLPFIDTVAQQIGRAELADDTWGVNYSEVHIELKPLDGEASEEAEASLRQKLASFPGVYFAVRRFLAERIEETISGATSEVVIKIFGDNLDLLDAKAREVARVVSGITGASDVQVESPPGAPRIVVRLEPARLVQLGFRPLDVLECVGIAYEGSRVAQTFHGDRVFDVTVILDPRARRDPAAVGRLMLANTEGVRVPLGELADIYEDAGRTLILHEGTRRRQAVTCDVRGRDLASFVREAQRTVQKKVSFPKGSYAVFGGASQAREQARRELLLHSSIAAAGIILVLAVVFNSTRNLLLVLANLPFALVGGVLAVFSTGGLLTVGGMVGFVTLFGITMRNSMMLISHFEHLVRQEGVVWGIDAALRGASERLAPILMTAIVTGLGLLPLAIGSGEPGREIEGPMAVVILGGLVTSTLLNLMVLPTLAVRYGRFENLTGEPN
jgi:CzcA family heavy metal efflux pump